MTALAILAIGALWGILLAHLSGGRLSAAIISAERDDMRHSVLHLAAWGREWTVPLRPVPIIKDPSRW